MLRSLPEPASEDHSLRERLEALELKRATWEAEIEALVLKAKGQYDSARNAEERTKTMKKAYETDSEEGALEGEAEILEAYRKLGIVPVDNGAASEESEMREVRQIVGRVSGKAVAQRAKFGV